MHHSELLALCISSQRQSIENKYYFNSVKKAWFKIIRANHVYTTIEKSFNSTWCNNWHFITKEKKCSFKTALMLNNCSNLKFNELRV